MSLDVSQWPYKPSTTASSWHYWIAVAYASVSVLEAVYDAHFKHDRLLGHD